jgi:hypothetical protein
VVGYDRHRARVRRKYYALESPHAPQARERTVLRTLTAGDRDTAAMRAFAVTVKDIVRVLQDMQQLRMTRRQANIGFSATVMKTCAMKHAISSASYAAVDVKFARVLK